MYSIGQITTHHPFLQGYCDSQSFPIFNFFYKFGEERGNFPPISSHTVSIFNELVIDLNRPINQSEEELPLQKQLMFSNACLGV